MSSISKLLFLLLFLSCTTFMACSKSEESLDSQVFETLRIDLRNIKGISMSDYFTGIEYVPLIPPEDKYIGRVRKIVKQDSLIAFFDRARNSIWIFAETGEYINEVRIPIGRGPGEVEHLNDIILTSDYNIHALGSFKIVSYDLEGNFLDEIDFDFFIYKLAYDENIDTFIGYTANHLNEQLRSEHSGHNLFWINSEGEIIKSAVPIPRGREHMGAEVPNKFPVFNNKISFFPRLADTVYTINNGEVAPRYYLDFGDHSITDELFELRYQYSSSKFEWSEFQRNEIFGEDYVGLISEFYESDVFIYFSFNTGDRHSIIIDKADNNFSIAKGRIINDIDYGPATFYNFLLDGKFYTVLYPHEIKERLEYLERNEPDKFNSERVEELKELSELLQSTDNPVLKISSLK